MAWQVAIVVDSGEPVETLHANLHILLGQMPVWAIAAYERVPGASELRMNWNNCWSPEPALTLAPGAGNDKSAEVLDLIPTIEEHHPHMCTVRVFGLDNSDVLANGLADLGFNQVSGTSWDGAGFARPVSQIQNVPIIDLDATEWRSSNDFYDAFFKAVGAPDWHGRNYNALNDSIGGGGINNVEVPYRIVVRNASFADSGSRDVIKDFTDLIRTLQANGCPVEMRIEN